MVMPASEHAAGARACTNRASDLYVCAQDAVRAMVEHISTTYDLGREGAYLLSSLVVDAGQYIVSALLPEAVFTGG
jgi:acetamidase/formamidase